MQLRGRENSELNHETSFDQNISFRIIPKIKDIFPDAVQVRMVGLENKTDMEIWHFARINDQWRIVFRWKQNNSHDVKVIDYH